MAVELAYKPQKNLEQKVTGVEDVLGILNTKIGLGKVVGIEDVLGILNTKIGLGNVARSYGKECWGNKFLEIACIVASDLGNVAAAGLFHGMNYVNSIAALSGGATGLGYASLHLNRNAKKEGKKPSALEVFLASLSAEFGCVTGTNLVASGMAHLWATNPDFFSVDNWEVRLLSYLASWPVGTMAMSTMTLAQKDEAGRFVLKLGKTEDLKRFLYEDLKKIGFGEEVGMRAYVDKNNSGNKVTLYSGDSNVSITEKKLPGVYHDKINPETNSLYLVKSNIARYMPKARSPLASFAKNSFKAIGYDPVKVENPFVHNHSHHHSHAA